MKIIFNFFLAIVFIGCSKQNQIAYNIPSWYLKSHISDIYLYGTGSGYTKQEAINDALNNISSSISIKMTSLYHQKKSSLDINGYSKTYMNKIEQNLYTKTLNINFTDVKVDKIQKLLNKIYVLVKINKKDLINSNIERLLQQDKIIMTQMKLAIDNYTTILQYQKIKNNIEKAQKIIGILQVLKSDINYKSYLDKYLKYRLKYQTSLNKLKIVIISNNSYFKNSLIKFINDNNLTYIKKSSNPDILIHDQNKLSFNKFKGWFIVKVMSNIDIEYNNTIVNSMNILSIGRSSISQDLALQRASYNFYEKLKKQNFLKIK